MANKASTAIELKDISSYQPIEEEKKRESLSLPQENPPRAVNLSNLSSSQNASFPTRMSPNSSETQAIIPNSSAGSPPSYLEGPRPQPQGRIEDLRYPALNPPPYRFSAPPQQAVYFSIQCSGCRGMIQYPPHASMVFCIHCKATTATKPLINISCMYCKRSAMYTVENEYVKCRCGMVYSIRTA